MWSNVRLFTEYTKYTNKESEDVDLFCKIVSIGVCMK